MSTIVRSDILITGNIVSHQDVQIEGSIEGDIKSRIVTVDEGAIVKGSISADEVVINGTVNGDITSKTVTLSDTADVHGDITHDHLFVNGGTIEGRLKRYSQPPKPETESDQKAFAAAKREIENVGPKASRPTTKTSR